MTPNERKTLHLEGTVENVLYCNPDNGYTVLELNADGTLVTVVGEMGETEEGERLSVDGEYTTHPRFGMQFRAQYWERKLPADAFNIQRYLSSGAIKGIGPSLAKKIVENFGDRTLEIMEKEPTRLLEIRGISPKKCEAIAAEVRQIFSLRTLMLFLSQYDIRSKYAMRAYQHWGTGAMDMLAANPYLLCSSGVELDFQKADAVAQGMQFAHNAPQRIQAGICYILQYNTNGGNACLPLDRLRPTACKYLQVNEAEFEIAYAAALEDHTLYVYEKNGRDFVYLEDYCVSLSERLMPASEVSEQISLAGTEASGTGNMKFMLNGAITLGTLDGANVEIADAAGKENELIFGMLTPEVNNLKQVGYHPNAFITGDDVANYTLNFLERGWNGENFHEVTENLRTSDPYMVMADFKDYRRAQADLQKLYGDREKWAQMSLKNTANSGIFSADRAVLDYARDIWHASTVPMGK